MEERPDWLPEDEPCILVSLEEWWDKIGRIEKLEAAIREHRTSIRSLHPVTRADRKLWNLAPDTSSDAE